MAQQVAINRNIRRAYRKRLLPLVEQCLLGRAVPLASHHERTQLDAQSVYEILGCFDGDTWINCISAAGLGIMWHDWVKEQKEHGGRVSIGNFVRSLYDEQCNIDAGKIIDGHTVTVSGLHEKRTALMATLYVAGYLPAFEPESLLEIA